MSEKSEFRAQGQRLVLIGLSLAGITVPALAGDWTITPMIAVSETATDNLFLSGVKEQSGFVTNVTPGIRIDGAGDRSKLHLNYQMNNLFYSVDPSQNNQIQNSLNAMGTLEAVENWLFVDASGNIFQQSISAFGAAPTSGSVSPNVNGNISETSNYQISPYIRGSFGGFADYQLRYNVSNTSSQASSAFDTTTQTWTANLNGATRFANFGWAIDGSAQTIEQSNLRSKQDNRLRFVLSYQFSPQFQLSLIGGREENNIESRDMEGSTIKGAGFEWSPTDRTKMAFSREDRFFGPSNTFSFSHRTALTAWKMSASKDVAVQQNQGVVGLGTNYDLLYTMLSAQNPSLSPAAVATLVNTALQSAGIDPNAQLQSGFLANQTVLQQLRQVSFALLGARNTVMFSATQNSTQNITLLNGLGASYGSGPSQNNVDQLGVSINWSHKLTPMSSLIATVAHSNSKGSGLNKLETTQNLANLNWVTRLGPNTSAGVGARWMESDGTADYSEKAITATLSHQF